MMDYRGKEVVVVGLGRSGVAAARFLAERGARVIACDAKPREALAEASDALAHLPVELRCSSDEVPTAVDLIVASPGVATDAPWVDRARARGVPIVGELELAVREIDRPIVAITGTNGKTTTTALVGHLLEHAGMQPCVAGNIGTPLIAEIDRARDADAVVLEVSSFQIETAPSLAPQMAIWLNATPDHLDRHGSFDGYVAAKARLFAQIAEGGSGIYNADDEAVTQAVLQTPRRLLPFDATGRLLGEGTRGPRAWFDAGRLAVDVEGGAVRHFDLTRVALPGRHNRENMLAALAAALLCGAEAEALRRGLECFRGLPHRLELVVWHEGVPYYDDSKGTNVGATVRALEAFAEPIVLIAGGRNKGADFAALAPIVRERVKQLVLIGEAADEIAAAVGGAVPTARASDMSKAVARAAAAASPGDVVLLSPACASFDQFRDYADRGRRFAEAVRALATSAEGDGVR